MWTHTRNALEYFDSITKFDSIANDDKNGWITYTHNELLVKLFSHALVATAKGHEEAMKDLKKDIEEQKNRLILE